jgi:hypothetical protein
MARPAATVLTDAQKAEAAAKRQTEKTQKFVDLANKRVPKVLDAIAQLRGLANKNNYAFTPAHVAAIMKELEDAVVKVGKAFNGSTTAATGFSLTVNPVPNGGGEAEKADSVEKNA